MENPDTLEIVFRLMDQFGPNAEMIAAEHLDRAMEAANAEDYDAWCLVAETIAALSERTNKMPKVIELHEYQGSVAA